MKNNQFNIGDIVVEKGKKSPAMTITSIIPGGLDSEGKIGIETYLKTDKYTCEWGKEPDIHSKDFKGDELEPYVANVSH